MVCINSIPLPRFSAVASSSKCSHKSPKQVAFSKDPQPRGNPETFIMTLSPDPREKEVNK